MANSPDTVLNCYCSIACAWSIILLSSPTPGDESICAGLATLVLVFVGGLHTLGEWGVSSGATNGVSSLIFNSLKQDRFGDDTGADEIDGANEADGVDEADKVLST